MTLFQQIIETIKTLIINPLSVILICIILFRKQLSNLIEQLSDVIKNRRIEVGNIVKISQPQEKTSVNVSSSLEKFIRSFDSAITDKYEELIKTEFLKYGMENETDPQKKVEALLRYSAVIRIIFDFDRIALNVYGSQINILNFLNSKQTQGEAVNILKSSFYDSVATAHPNVFANYTFEQYMNFLISFTLVQLKGNQCFITDFGREFLKYIVAAGLTGQRPY